MTHPTLADLGWSAHFANQIDSDTSLQPARLSGIHRDRVDALTPQGQISLIPTGPVSDLAVGDWVEHDSTHVIRRLAPHSVILRRAAGGDGQQQMIAANVDTLGIVTSCNADFNVARLERYLALAASAGALPLILLTKADAVPDPDTWRARAERLSPLATAMALDARDPDDVARLVPWCGQGQTLALVGSSGVGKTTLRNLLTGESELTAAIREDDDRGRHTTTARALCRTMAGGWLIDTPGMRELGLSDAADGVDAAFADLADLALNCRFADCAHDSEPGCAVRAAIAGGDVAADRFDRWQRLQREDRINSENAAQTRARHRSRQKLYNAGKRRGRSKRGFDE